MLEHTQTDIIKINRARHSLKSALELSQLIKNQDERTKRIEGLMKEAYNNIYEVKLQEQVEIIEKIKNIADALVRLGVEDW